MSLQRHARRHQRHLTVTAALGAALLVSGGLTARGQATAPARDVETPEVLIRKVDLVSAPLSVALNVVRQQTGIDIVIKEGQYERVNVSLKQKPVSEVLKLIAASAGADIWTENGVYFVGPKGSGPRIAEPTPLPQTVASVEPAHMGPVKYEKFYMKYTPARRMKRMLGLAESDPLDPDEQFMVAANKAFIAAQYPRPTFLTGPNFPSNNADGRNAPGQPPISPVVPGPPVAPAANSGRSVLPANGTDANNSGSASNVNQSGGGNPDQSAHRDADDPQSFGRGQGLPGGAAGGFQPPGAGGTPGSGGQPAGTGVAGGFLGGINGADIYALDADNSLILRYQDPQDIANLQEALRVLDVKPRQIQIKAEFVTVQTNDVSAFGLNFNFAKVNLQAGANLGASTASTAFIQYAAGNLQTLLTFIQTSGRGKIVASPLATTLNGVAVTFQNQTNIPVFISQISQGNNGSNSLQSNVPVLIPVTVILSVLPRINGDESILLLGNVTFSDVAGTVTNPSGGTIPITVSQTVSIQRIVRNGDSMVIGGLTRKRDSISTNKIPLLGDLPLLGTLFRSRTVSTDDSELLVFITPSIIPERPSNAVLGGGGGGAGGLPPVGGANGLPPVGGAGGLMP